MGPTSKRATAMHPAIPGEMTERKGELAEERTLVRTLAVSKEDPMDYMALKAHNKALNSAEILAGKRRLTSKPVAFSFEICGPCNGSSPRQLLRISL
jgi:hypothetical protein